MKLTFIAFLFGASLLAQTQNAVQPTKPVDVAPYGFQVGTVVGFAAFGGQHETGGQGLHPAIGTGFEVGFHRYLGLFGEAAYSRQTGSASSCYYYYCASASATANYYDVAGGLEVVGTNRTRVVPYSKVGMAYVAGTAHIILNGVYSGSGSYSASAPAALVAGGVRAYITHHVGVDFRLTGLRTLGNNGGSTIVSPTVGVFFQSR